MATGTSVLKLVVDDRQYEASLKDAKRGMQDLQDSLQRAGKTFNDCDKAMADYARGLGQMETTSKTAKGRVGELQSAFVEISTVYRRMTDEEKQSPFGQATAAGLEQLRGRALAAKQELVELNRQLEAADSGGGASGRDRPGAGGLLGQIGGQFGLSPKMLTGVGAAVTGLGAAFKLAGDNIRTAMNFEKSMSQLSSLTGKTGQELEQLKEYAIELGSTSTLTASEVADAFKLIGSQQPQLLQSSEALKEVTKYAITLSEAAGIDLVTASQTLSTSINQMGGESKNAARYVNVLAAASQKGAGDISWLGEAITKSGTTAKMVGTDYEQLVANLEQLAQAGFDASTAGTALRSIIVNLEKQANDELKPSVVGLTNAFANLGEKHLSVAEMSNLVGKMFGAQAAVLAENAEKARDLEKEITGTNIAEEQAKTNADNLDGSLKSLSSAWEGLNLHVNSSNGFLKDAVDWLKEVVVWADQAFTSAGKAQRQLQQMQGGGEGEQTTVDKQVGQLGSKSQVENWSTRRNQIKSYNKEIQHLKEIINAWDSWRNGNRGDDLKQLIDESRNKYKTTSTRDLQMMVDNLTKMRDEYRSRAEDVMGRAAATPQHSGHGGKVTLDVDIDDEEGKKSLQELQDEVKKLKKLRDEAANAGNTKLRDQYNAQIKDVQAEIKSMRGGTVTTTHKVKTETEVNDARVKELTAEYLKLGTAEKDATDEQRAAIEKRKAGIRDEIQVLKERNKELKRMADEANGLRIDDSSVQGLTRKLQELRTAQQEAADGKAWREYEDKIKRVSDRLAVMKGQLPKGQEAEIKVEVTAEGLELLRGLTVDDKTIHVNVEEGRVELPDVPADDKTIHVNVEEGRVELPDVPADDKTIRVNVEEGRVELPDVPADDKTIHVNVEEGRVELPDVPADDKTIHVNVEEGRVELPDVLKEDEKTITVNVTATSSEGLREVLGVIGDDFKEVEIRPKVSLDNVEQDVRSAFERLQDNIRLEIAAKNIDVDKNTLKSLTEVVTKYDIKTGSVDMQQVMGQAEALTEAGMAAGEAYQKALRDALAQNIDLSSVLQQIGEQVNIPDETWTALQDSINAKLKELNVEPIKIDLKTGGVTKQAKEMTNNWQSAAQAIQQVGSAMQGIEDPAAKVMGTIAQAIATIALGYAQATVQAADMGPWAWVAFAATGLATMLSSISTIHSATGFAEGGMVQGNTYSMDQVPAMLNAGEVVLNKAQQGALASQLQDGGGGGLGVSHISGEQIWVALNRYAKRTGRGELVTWR